MPKRYDVIVIGAGLGGLSAATRLALEGLRVLLLERHNVPGGYATSFVRGRFEFEVALHELSGMGKEGEPTGNIEYLQRLGVAQGLEFAPVKDLYRSVFPGVDLRLPVGREAYEATLCDAFPADAEGIRRFLGRVFALAHDTVELEKTFASGRFGWRDVAAAPFRFPNAARYLPVTWGQVLERDVKGEAARAVLSQYWGYFGLPPSRMAFLYFAIALATYIRYGATYVRGRSQALSNAFLAAFERHGGEALFNTPVTRIVTSAGRVTGVEVEGDARYAAPVVLSNASPLTTAVDLLGPGAAPEAWLKRLKRETVGPSTVNVYLGVNRDLVADGFTDHETFVNESFDQEAHHAATSTLEAPPCAAITCYNAVWPAISPPGTSMVVLTALSRGEPWLGLAPERYHATKQRLADRLLDLAERVVPGLRDATETLEVSTPLTNMRFAANPGGSIYGFDQPPWSSTALRHGARSPVGGLWLAGAWVQPGGGFEPCIVSGRMAAEGILAARRTEARHA